MTYNGSEIFIIPFLWATGGALLSVCEYYRYHCPECQLLYIHTLTYISFRLYSPHTHAQSLQCPRSALFSQRSHSHTHGQSVSRMCGWYRGAVTGKHWQQQLQTVTVSHRVMMSDLQFCPSTKKNPVFRDIKQKMRKRHQICCRI